MRYLAVLFISSIILTVVSCKSDDKIEQAHSLTISDGFVNPIGFYDSQPSFSWKLPVSKQVKAQSAYSIVLASSPSLLPDRPNVWHSGKVISNQSILKLNSYPLF